jgi:hypothetical protein
MCKLNLVLAVMLLPVFLMCITIEVPGDYSTIQAAINASSDGDVIEVSAGIYEESVEIYDKAITLLGVGGVKETIIDGSGGDGSVIAILSDINHDDDFVIEGFTIRGGNGRETVHFGGGIYCEGENGILSNLLIFGNNVNVNGKGGGIYLDNTETLIENCTIANNYAEINGGGLYLDGNCAITLLNSIVYQNTIDSSTRIPVFENIYMDNSSNSIDISYTLLHGGIDDINANGGTVTHSNVIEDDPKFCTYNDEDKDLRYYLLENSVCIDAGHPSSIYNDSDGTRSDLGAVDSSTDIRYCCGNRWNWDSFPRVGTSYYDIYDTVSNILDMDDLYPIYDDDPAMQVSAQNSELYAYYSLGAWVYNPALYSMKGYKLLRDDPEDFYVPLEGYRLSNTYQFSFNADQENWLGYWIPETRNIADAFNDLWSHVKTIQAEQWYYQRPSGGFGTPSSSTVGKNLEYGKMYIVTLDITTTYTWDPPGGGGVTKSSERETPKHFTFNDQPDYLALDVLDIPQDIKEIGVFQGITCIGAAVVDSSSVQLLSYIDPDLRDNDYLSLQFISGESMRHHIENCWVYDEKTEEFKKDKLHFQGRKYLLLSLNDDYPIVNSQIPDCYLNQNYPNPFNPETNISFYLGSSVKDTELNIYNIRGQNIRSFNLDDREPGHEHTIVWNGRNEQGNKVSSGIYFYQLKSDQGSVSRKMLLMK